MKKYLLGIFAVILAVSLSAFTQAPKSTKSKLNTYYWYKVDYSSNSAGEIAPNTPVEFSGSKITQPLAQSSDDCDDVSERHCLRGFSEMPDLSQDPVTTYDESTPAPENE